MGRSLFYTLVPSVHWLESNEHLLIAMQGLMSGKTETEADLLGTFCQIRFGSSGGLAVAYLRDAKEIDRVVGGGKRSHVVSQVIAATEAAISTILAQCPVTANSRGLSTLRSTVAHLRLMTPVPE